MFVASILFACIVLQGERFGGALDEAARQFSEAYDAGMPPMEFVNSMRRQHKLIMGIGHRVKSVSVPAITVYSLQKGGRMTRLIIVVQANRIAVSLVVRHVQMDGSWMN